MFVEQLKDGRWRVRYKKGRNQNDPNRPKEYFGRDPEAEKQARKRDAELKDRRIGKSNLWVSYSVQLPTIKQLRDYSPLAFHPTRLWGNSF